MTDEHEPIGARPTTVSGNTGGSQEVPRQVSTEGRAHSGLRDRRAVIAREKKRYGGIKWGSAFFGWLTATGTALILTAILAAMGAVIGVVTTSADATGQAAQRAGTISVAGGIALLAVILAAYYCGGYVAGRMARFDGVKQGLAVWIWAMIFAVLAALTVAVFGSRFDLLSRLDGLPRIPNNSGDATAGAIVAVVIAVLAALAGAVVGGLAGMRFHRRVDKAGLGY